MIPSNTPATHPENGNFLFDSLYDELKKIARSQMRHENINHTLQPTALVNEAYLRLMTGRRETAWESKKHFLCTAAVVMRKILVDSARNRNSKKRGGDFLRVELSDTESSKIDPLEDILSIHEILNKMYETHPEFCELINLRFFVGLSVQEAADVMGISRTKAVTMWSFAKAWLHVEISK